ncbi:MAG: amidohydrolase [Candidatus Izemoplasmataceae bacterium]
MKIAYIHGKLFNQKNDAFIVENGRFTAFGKTSQILNKPIDKVIDLNHHYIMPGFNDSHLHVLGIGKSMNMFNASNYPTIPAIIEALKAFDIDPLIGRGFHESQFEEKRALTKEDLDLVSKEKPIIIYRVCGHMVVANSRAIELAEALKHPFPEDKDSVDLALGHFKEDAIAWIFAILDHVTKEQIQSEFLMAQDYLLKYGVTSVGSDDFAMYKVPFEVILEAIKELDDQGKIKIRVLEQANIPKLEDFKRFIDKNLVGKIYNRYRMGPLKLLADGSLGARSAYMRDPYNDADTVGIKAFSKETLKAFIETANDAGMDFAIHAIGDQMTEEICDVVEGIDEENRVGRRHSIIHAQLTRSDQIARMKTLNIGAQTQPIFINSDFEGLEAAIGARMNDAYLFYSMYKEGVLTTISTDAPVEDASPFDNLYCAITRKSIKRQDLGVYNSSECFPFIDAVKAYTEKPAYFSYQEQELGKLATGYLADFIVVDHLKVDEVDSLLKAKVLKTFIEGEEVFSL